MACTNRTTTAAVEGILQKDYAPGADLTQFMFTACVMVTQCNAIAARKGLSIDSDTQERMEAWLAAHFYAQSDKPYQNKSMSSGGGSASGTYQGQTSQGLTSTLYGQTALRLDFTGSLEVLDKRKVARMSWLGKPPSSQIPYYQRD
jgi:hypothetical protein